MEKNQKIEAFIKELARIKDPSFKNFCSDIAGIIPDEFFVKPASSTGKYHPKLSVTVGGLMWHTRCAFWFGVAMIKPDAPFSFFTRDEKDVGLAALLFHDTMKYGFDGGAKRKGNTYFEHPLLVKDLIDVAMGVWVSRNTGIEMPQKTMSMINALVESVSAHMGNWNTNNFSKIILPRPSTKLQKFVHFCDYISAQKFCHFDNDELDGFIATLPAGM